MTAIVLHLTAHKTFGGGTQIARTILRCDDVVQNVWFLEKHNEQVLAPDQLFYKDFSAALTRFRQLLRENDTVIVHSHGRIAGFYARLFKLLFPLRVKVVHTFHGIGSFLPLRRAVSCVIEAGLSLFTSRVIFNSNSERKAFRPFPILCRAQVISNGIASDKLVPHQSRDVRSIGFAATMAFPKMHREMVELIAEYNTRYPEKALRLVFCGDGAGRDAVDTLGRKLLKERYVSMGQLSDMKAFFSEIDLYFHFSRYESFGLSLAEAMGCGIPSIAIRGVDLIESEQNGLLVDVDDTQTQIAAINTLVEDTKLRKRLATAASKTIEERFTSETMIKNYVQLYRSLD